MRAVLEERLYAHVGFAGRGSKARSKRHRSKKRGGGEEQAEEPADEGGAGEEAALALSAGSLELRLGHRFLRGAYTVTYGYRFRELRGAVIWRHASLFAHRILGRAVCLLFEFA